MWIHLQREESAMETAFSSDPSVDVRNTKISNNISEIYWITIEAVVQTRKVSYTTYSRCTEQSRA